MNSNLQAVITGDLIGSEGLSLSERDSFIEWIHSFSKDLNRTTEKYDILFELTLFRGDSFQVVITEVGQALQLALRMHAALASLNELKSNRNLTARIAIGIGTIEYNSKRLEEADGEAFHLSGKLLDEMKTGRFQRVRLATTNPELNSEFAIHCLTLDNVITQWSPAQAKVVSLALENHTQQKIAEQLEESQSAVNQKLRASSYPLVEKILRRFEQKMTEI